jgi:hypothetical protein
MLAAGVLLAGCSTNELKVDNETDLTIDFLFRGNRYEIAANSRQTIDEDIPNGKFDYTGVPDVIAPFKYVDGGGLSGEVSFQQSKTDVLLVYTAVLSSQTYTVKGSMSTNLASGSTGP